MFRVYLILRDGRGAHEPEAVMSVWADKWLAEDEAERLRELSVARFGEDAASWFYAKGVDLNEQNDEHPLT